MLTVDVQGISIPKLGFGTYKASGAECASAVELALRTGYRHIDTAQGYGNEQEVGEGIKQSSVDRSELFVTTKLDDPNHSAERVRSSTEESLRTLDMDFVDLLLIHWPGEDVGHAETLDAMRGLADDGLIRSYGVSNFTPSQVREAANHAPIVANQVEYHPLLDQTELLELAREYDHMLTAYSPIARGKVADEQVMKEIAEEHDTSPMVVALRWLLQQENVSAIPKASSAEHIESNFTALDIELSDAQMRRIDGLSKGERLVDPSGFDWER
ncbi:MAG: aldo/keto reductase [Egibacteraceae bacterium]